MDTVRYLDLSLTHPAPPRTLYQPHKSLHRPTADATVNVGQTFPKFLSGGTVGYRSMHHHIHVTYSEKRTDLGEFFPCSTKNTTEVL